MTTVTHSPGSCIGKAFDRLAGAVGLVLRNPGVDHTLQRAVLRSAYDDADHLVYGGYVPVRRHSDDAPPGADTAPWNAIPG